LGRIVSGASRVWAMRPQTEFGSVDHDGLL
jgi:hypothetical protein